MQTVPDSAELAEGVRSLWEVFPVIHAWYWQATTIVGALTATLIGSELIMRWYVRRYVKSTVAEPGTESPTDTAGAGRVIGKCENIIIFVLVMLGHFDGLGFVLAAKSIARMDAMRKNPSYYLGGTLVNFVWSMLVGLLARVLVVGA